MGRIVQGSFPPTAREVTGLKTGYAVAGVTVRDTNERARYLAALAEPLREPVGEGGEFRERRWSEVQLYVAAVYASVEAEEGPETAARVLEDPAKQLESIGAALEGCHLRASVEAMGRINQRGVLVHAGDGSEGALLTADARRRLIHWAGKPTPLAALQIILDEVLRWRVRENAKAFDCAALLAKLPPAPAGEAQRYAVLLRDLGEVIATFGLSRRELVAFLHHPGVLSESHTEQLRRLGKEREFRELCSLVVSQSLGLYRQAVSTALRSKSC